MLPLASWPWRSDQVGLKIPLPRLRRMQQPSHDITEPMIGPVRRVLKPVRFGSISIDLAFTAVFVAVIVLRTVVVAFIPF
ncbi:MAG TPA: YggT family protein [Pseudonocardiaceae bacterium]|nr:YggT family protein [Pseudonocardiaceae bacterium]